jgi:hypothetical protein
MWVAIAGAAIQAISQIQQGGDAARAMNTQADMLNASATNARQVAAAREERTRYENALKLGEQRAIAAQSGADPNRGTTLSLQKESAGNAELSALYQRYEGELRAIDLGNEAAALKGRAKTARRQGYLSAAGTVLSAFGRYGMGSSMGSSAIASYADTGAATTYGGKTIY